MSQSTIINIPVQSVNGETGAITLDNTDVGAAASIHTHIESDITDLGSYLKDAPSDGNIYGRQNAGWFEITDTSGIGDAPLDGLPYIRKNESWIRPKLVSSGISSTNVAIKIEDGDPTDQYSISSATTSLAGVLSAADKTKLDSIPTSLEEMFTEDVTRLKSTSSPFSIFADSLNGLPKNLNGYTLTIRLEDGIHTFSSGDSFILDGFKNGTIIFKKNFGATSVTINYDQSENFQFINFNRVHLDFRDINYVSNYAGHISTFLIGDNTNGSITSYSNGFDQSLATIKAGIYSFSGITSFVSSQDSFSECGTLMYLNSGTFITEGGNRCTMHVMDNYLSGATGVTFIGVGLGLSIINEDGNTWATNIAGTSAIQLATI